jgi:Lrp/AsnC family leucine-responsive transcriptional regulator
LDFVDREILRVLLADGRMSQEAVAREVNLSRPAVHERIKRLEESGVIRGYRTLVDWAALGYPVTAFVWVRVSGKVDTTGGALMALADEASFVEECHRVTGEWCLLLKARLASPLALQDLIDRAREVEGVEATMTSLALSELEGDVIPARRRAVGRFGTQLGEAGA